MTHRSTQILGCLLAAVCVFALLGCVPSRGLENPGEPVKSPKSQAPLPFKWGLTEESGPTGLALVERRERELGRPAQVVNQFVTLADPAASVLRQIEDILSGRDRSQITMITLEPDRVATGSASTVAPGESGLRAVVDGKFDWVFAHMAQVLRNENTRVAIRFAHEPNGAWYGWAGEPELYKEAWRVVYDAFDGLGASRPLMVWSVNNVDRPETNRAELYWPGAEYVDIVGIDAYNCLNGWQSPEQLVGPIVARLRRVAAGSPIWLTEVASCEAPEVAETRQSKGQWIATLGRFSSTHDISAVIWFDRDKEKHWSLSSSSEALNAMREMLRR